MRRGSEIVSVNSCDLVTYHDSSINSEGASLEELPRQKLGRRWDCTIAQSRCTDFMQAFLDRVHVHRGCFSAAP